MSEDNKHLVDRGLVEAMARELKARKLSIALAESATAGRVMSEFALVKKAGEFLKGGLVCYDACVKQDLMKIPSDLIDKYTPESPEVTEAIAVALTRLVDADLHIGITGLTAAGGSETEEKPVGTMFMCGLYKAELLFNERFTFGGEAEDIVTHSVNACAGLIKDYVAEIYHRDEVNNSG